MNEILQNRIEKAKKEYEDSLALPKWDIKEIHGIDFMNGATFALQNQWISVDEALPDEDEQVIVMSEIGTVEQMKYHNKAFYHLKGSIIKDGEKITHWIEIPSLKGYEKAEREYYWRSTQQYKTTNR